MTLELISPPQSIRDPVPDDERSASGVARAVTALIVVLPFVALVFAVVSLWGHGIYMRDAVLAIVLYMLIGHGVTIGYHRLLTHRSFTACRPLKVALVAVGSMAFEGGPIGWVASHRRHHALADRPGDPHSPYTEGAGVGAQIRGLWHAHVGWLFASPPTVDEEAADLRADPDIMVIDRLFPMWCVVSLGLPFGIGWLLGGTFTAALSALLWGGLVRICVLHHATWSVNSLCHTFGRRPFATRDRSSNVAALAVLSFGESWHNGHHAFPRSARHGLLPFQWDSSALVIRGFERLSWVTDVHEPSPEAIVRRRAVEE